MNQQIFRRQKPIPGFTLIEIVISLALLAVVMTITTSASFQVGRLWRSSDVRGVAMLELSSAMQQFTGRQNITASDIEAWQFSPQAALRLPDAKLRGEILNDDLGRRLQLRIEWSDSNTPPLQLVGWFAEQGR